VLLDVRIQLLITDKAVSVLIACWNLIKFLIL